eukprot:1151770-Pelagomonas_calceolata.AAC.1
MAFLPLPPSTLVFTAHLPFCCTPNSVNLFHNFTSLDQGGRMAKIFLIAALKQLSRTAVTMPHDCSNLMRKEPSQNGFYFKQQPLPGPCDKGICLKHALSLHKACKTLLTSSIEIESQLPGMVLCSRSSQEWLVSNNFQQTEITVIRDTSSCHICATLGFHARQHNCNAILCRSHHHVFAIKRVLGDWKLLDSLKNRPIDPKNSNTDLPPFTIYKLSHTYEDDGENIAPPSSPYMDKAFCLVHSFRWHSENTSALAITFSLTSVRWKTH